MISQIDALDILSRLEAYRVRLNESPKSAGNFDHVVRMCQAYVAHGTFSDRNEWTDLLKASATKYPERNGGVNDVKSSL